MRVPAPGRKVSESTDSTQKIFPSAALTTRSSSTGMRRAGLRKNDIRKVLERFEEEFEASLLRHKVAVDTTGATVSESLEEMIAKILPFLPDADRERLIIRDDDHGAGPNALFWCQVAVADKPPPIRYTPCVLDDRNRQSRPPNVRSDHGRHDSSTRHPPPLGACH